MKEGEVVINTNSIKDYFEVVTSGLVGEESVEELRDVVYRTLEKEGQTRNTQGLWELYVRKIGNLNSNYEKIRGWKLEDEFIKGKLKYRGLVTEKNKEDEKHNQTEFMNKWGQLSWDNSKYLSEKEINKIVDDMEEMSRAYTDLTQKRFILYVNEDIRELDVPLITSLGGYLLDDVLRGYRKMVKDLYEGIEGDRYQSGGVYKEQMYYRTVGIGIKRGTGVTKEEVMGATTVVLKGNTGSGKTTNVYKLVSEILHSHEEDELKVNILKGGDSLWEVLERHPNVKRNHNGDKGYLEGLKEFIEEYERRKGIYKEGWEEGVGNKDPKCLIVIDGYTRLSIREAREIERYHEKLEGIMKETKDLGMRIIVTCHPSQSISL